MRSIVSYGKVSLDQALFMFPYSNAIAKLIEILPRKSISNTAGALCDLTLPPALSKTIVGIYSKFYHVDLTEFEKPDNGSFCNFDQFFTRRLLPGKRNWPSHLGVPSSPSDGKLISIGQVDSLGSLKIKGQSYSISDLVGNKEDAEYFKNGSFALIYLSPRDYHRVHIPLSGKLVKILSLPGELYPVNELGERNFPQLFVRNRRIAMTFLSEENKRFMVVMVGALIVGRITVDALSERDVPIGSHVFEQGISYKRGDEIGAFHLGSTVVLFEENSNTPWNAPLGEILLGDPLRIQDSVCN